MKKGFTLIELLMVLALIGILSGIILASIDKIREKGYDAKMESNFSTLKAQSERYYSKYNTFGINTDDSNNLCTAPRAYGFGSANGPGIFKDLAEDAGVSPANTLTQNETKGEWNRATCHATNDAWAVESPLPDSTEAIPSMYCEDSTGLLIKQKNINLDQYDYSCL
jgi:prepilin-type N-terminal cleavage/methylation domain-containing protein